MNGILPLWKPAGMTSHDCVNKLRKMLKMKKIGHTGTLDPSVTGVLPICIGEATKISKYLMEMGKSYIGEVTIGFSTTTEDQDGEIVDKKPVTSPITRDQIIQVLDELTGEIVQIPPMYSSVKVSGKRLYEYARQGIEVERPKRKVTIYELMLLDDQEEFEGGTISFSIKVKCSKGTYIRTLAVMIGEKLGYPSHMSKLVRIESAGIDQTNSLTFDQIEKLLEKGNLNEKLISMENALHPLKKWEVEEEIVQKVKNGAVLPIPLSFENELDDEPIVVQNDGKLLAIYKKHPTKPGMMKPERVFNLNK